MGFVGAFDAKTHLSELLDRVGRGEKRYDYEAWRSCGDAGPSRGNRSARMTHREIVEGMRKLRKRMRARQDERPSDEWRGRRF